MAKATETSNPARGGGLRAVGSPGPRLSSLQTPLQTVSSTPVPPVVKPGLLPTRAECQQHPGAFVGAPKMRCRHQLPLGRAFAAFRAGFSPSWCMRPVHFQLLLPARGCCGQREGEDGPSQRRLLCPALQGRSYCCFRDRLRCLEPELIPASAGLWWRAANVTCLAPSQSGEEDGRRICTAGLCQAALAMPFLSVLAQPVWRKPLQGGRQKPWGCLPPPPPPGTSHSSPLWEGCCSYKWPSGQKYWDF